jgi:hypothetical protein
LFSRLQKKILTLQKTRYNHYMVNENGVNKMSHQALTLLKQLKVVSYADRVFASLIPAGIAGFADRIAFLENAKRNNNLK